MPNYPYISGQKALVNAFNQLRNSFPSKVDSGYLQRFNIAPSNESYIISILKFLGLIDEEGNRVEDKTEYFFGNDDDAFKDGFETTLRSAYANVFEEMGEGALDSTKSDLTHWFRAADRTSDLVGQRQASTFQTLAALAGHGDLPVARQGGPTKKSATAGRAKSKRSTAKDTDKESAETSSKGESFDPPAESDGGARAEVGLSIRVEVNLPPGGDAETYDAIFASVRKHLMS